MIRINLLGVERTRPQGDYVRHRPAAHAGSGSDRRGGGARHWLVVLDVESRVGTARCGFGGGAAGGHSTPVAPDERQQFEAQREQLRQRVALITQLRSGQNIPVQLLDHISRSLPDMLWLTTMEQKEGR